MRLVQYPQQSDWVGRRVDVVFNFDPRHPRPGVIVRHDQEAPYVMIINLLNGQYVLATECAWSPCDWRLEERTNGAEP